MCVYGHIQQLFVVFVCLCLQTSSKGLTTASSTSADSAIYSTVCKMPSHQTPSSTSAAGVETEDLVDEEEEMHRKVAELQQRKLELQKKKKDNKVVCACNRCTSTCMHACMQVPSL